MTYRIRTVRDPLKSKVIRKTLILHLIRTIAEAKVKAF